MNRASPTTTFQFKQPSQPTTISLTAPSGAISRAGSFDLSGTITSGVPVGSSVSLLCEQPGGAYGDCGFGGSGQVTASGVWSVTGNVAPADGQKTVIASFAGAAGWAASHSAPVTITFATPAPQPSYTPPSYTPPSYTPPSYATPGTASPAVTVTVPTSGATSPQILTTVKGTTVTGKLAKRQVRKVRLQRQTGAGVWKTVKSKKTSKVTGRVKFHSIKKGTQYRLLAPKRTLNGTVLPEAQSRVFTR